MATYSCAEFLCLIVAIKAADKVIQGDPGKISKPYVFTCHSSREVVTWTVNNTEFASCYSSTCVTADPFKYELNKSGQVFRLTIISVSLRDSGIYRCEDGISTSIFTFTVNGTVLAQSRAPRKLPAASVVACIFAAVSALVAAVLFVILLQRYGLCPNCGSNDKIKGCSSNTHRRGYRAPKMF